MNEIFEKIIEKLKEEKMSYFLTIANTGDEKLDYTYEQVGDALDKAIEIVKQEADQYKGGWIPCSSGVLPKRSNLYCVTKMCGNDENPIYETCHEIFWAYNNKWDCERDEDCEWRVIAWKEKEKPYQPNGE